MRHVAETTGRDLEALYENVAWPLYRLYGHAFDAFKTMVTDEGDTIFQRLEEDKGAAVQELLTPEVRRGGYAAARGRPAPRSLAAAGEQGGPRTRPRRCERRCSRTSSAA
jgi:translation initiation factor 2 subunit 1